jgi:hypothetical protein
MIISQKNRSLSLPWHQNISPAPISKAYYPFSYGPTNFFEVLFPKPL